MPRESYSNALAGSSHSKNLTPVFIRSITIDDAGVVARLSGELGYPCDTDAMRERIASALASPDRAVYVACIEEVVIAWIDLAIVHHLASGTYGEIAGFIVSTEHRSKGVGGSLIRKAERWMASKGVSKVVVRSRTTRKAAHRFYLREGYSLTKTSAVFSKELN